MRGAVLLVLLTTLAIGCGGSGQATAPAANPPSAPLSSREPQALDAASFQARVIGSPGAALVEFQRPT